MELKVHMQHGVTHGSTLTIPNEELDKCVLSMPGWAELAGSSGYLRHRVEGMPKGQGLPASVDPRTGEWRDKDKGIKRYKVPPEKHLGAEMTFDEAERTPAAAGLGLLDEHGRPLRRLVLIGNRNLGNNLWFVAWHKDKNPHCFHLETEPVTDREYTCLVSYQEGRLAIETISFVQQGEDLVPTRARDGARLDERVDWCTYGQQVLRQGNLVGLDELIEQFYDIRHTLYFQTPSYEGELELRDAYRDYPERFRQRASEAWMRGQPRSRYLHNAVGVGPDGLVIVQRHGTVEEIGHWLREAGAEDGLILDNGGSVFTWAWWAFKDVISANGKNITRTGNVIFSAPDWRPSSISLLAFVLKGAPRHEEPSGTVAMAMG